MRSALDIQVNGIVQGVGFRPFVYRLAQEYQITGWVLNAADGVKIHAEGNDDLLDRFVLAVHDRAPAAAKVKSMKMVEAPLQPFDAFEIRTSDQEDAPETTLVSPDLATCDDCVRELFDPSNRRYHYPFINCTNCGPRFTIIDGLPYDRPRTSMAEFTMCPDCAREYADPADRRFHAQPDACFECGPHISWSEAGSNQVSWGLTRQQSDAIVERAVAWLHDGKILAVKGLGGFHLVCDANNAQAIAELRRRKHREGKAFACMVAGVDDARESCEVSATEERVLTSPARPIVLLRKRADAVFAPGLADKLSELGIMLPATPLQHLLVRAFGGMLVMTSGNLHDDPIQTDDARARKTLAQVADAFVGNDRAIRARYDDSVVRVLSFDAPEEAASAGGAVEGAAAETEPASAAGEAGADVLGAGGAGMAAGDGAVAAGAETGAAGMATAGSAAAGATTSAPSASGTAPASAASPVSADSTSARAAAPADAHHLVQTDAQGKQTVVQCIRRARGYAPQPIALPKAVQQPAGTESARPVVFATGPEQKSTFCFARQRDAFVSQHIGDLEKPAAFDAWLEAKRIYEHLFDLQAGQLVSDRHPEYLSTKWAVRAQDEQGLPLQQAQHHHAHIVSAMAENDLEGPVCGIAFDGTGYGEDGAIWGGEVLLANLKTFERFANFSYVPMPGGAACVKHPLRMAYGVLWAFDLLEHPAATDVLQALGPAADICGQMIDRGLNTPMTSSVGRLFDAASALLDVCTEPRYEGEGAVLLEAAMGQLARDEGRAQAAAALTDDAQARYRIGIIKNTATSESTALDTSVVLFDAAPAFRALLDDKQQGVPTAVIALRFHHAFVETVLQAAALVRAVYGIRTVVLAGGVFMNRYIAEHSLQALEQAGYTAVMNCDLPPNDAGVSFGQAVVALARNKETAEED